MHDSLAVAALLDPSILKWKEYYVDVETSGELTAGETVGYSPTAGDLRRKPEMEKQAAENMKIRGSAPTLATTKTSPVLREKFVPNTNVAVDVDSKRFFDLLIGRRDIPVVPGAEYPLVRRREETELWEKRHGSVTWLGAWTPRFYHPPDQLGDFPEGKPTTKPADEDAAHFLIRMVHKFPGEVTIYEGGPMTNLALAISIDPEFPKLAKELVFMGASLSPETTDPEFASNPRHEFNLWFDPEAAHIVLRAPWKKIICTTVDISVKTQLTKALIDRMKAGNSPAAQYIGKYARLYGKYNYLWDELTAAAWLDPTLITKKELRFMDVDLDRGAG